jgi:hypothetical protein
MSFSIYDLIGVIGVAISVYCYIRLQWQRDYVKRLRFSILNFFAAAMLALSLLHNWNIAAFLGNTCWMFVSIYGIYRCLKYLAKEKEAEALKASPTAWDMAKKD